MFPRPQVWRGRWRRSRQGPGGHGRGQDSAGGQQQQPGGHLRQEVSPRHGEASHHFGMNILLIDTKRFEGVQTRDPLCWGNIISKLFLPRKVLSSPERRYTHSCPALLAMIQSAHNNLSLDLFIRFSSSLSGFNIQWYLQRKSILVSRNSTKCLITMIWHSKTEILFCILFSILKILTKDMEWYQKKNSVIELFFL